jgi:hypothetical protein
MSDFRRISRVFTPDFLQIQGVFMSEFLQKPIFASKKCMEMNYFTREIDRYLSDWKTSRTHKPLLLRGARQVGKSSAVRQLGKAFSHFIEVNFERDTEIAAIFDGNLHPKEIASRLSAFYGIPVVPGETLL